MPRAPSISFRRAGDEYGSAERHVLAGLTARKLTFEQLTRLFEQVTAVLDTFQCWRHVLLQNTVIAAVAGLVANLKMFSLFLCF